MGSPTLPPDTGPKKKKKKSKAAQHKPIWCVCVQHSLADCDHISLSFFLSLSLFCVVYCSFFSLSFSPYFFHNHVFVSPFLILSFLQYFSFLLCSFNTISWSLLFKLLLTFFSVLTLCVCIFYSFYPSCTY